MDAEKCNEDLDAVSDAPPQQEGGTEKTPVSNEDKPDEPQEPGEAPAEEAEQPVENGHASEPSEAGAATPPAEEAAEVKGGETPVMATEQTATLEAPPGGAGEPVSVAAATQQAPSGSPKQVADPAPALSTMDTESERVQLDEQPAAENSPDHEREPEPEDAPEPEPEQPESAPEAEQAEQTPPQPEAPPSQSEQAREVTVPPAEGAAPPPECVITDTTAEPKKEVGADLASVEMEARAGTQVAAEKPAGSETEEPAPAEVVSAAPAEVVKEAGAEEPVAAAAASIQEVESTGDVGEPQQKGPEEKLSGPHLLDQEQTRMALRGSRSLIVLRGLPGSGKSFLARAIADRYQDLCSVVCSDDHGVKPESPEASAEAYKALDEAVLALCTAGTAPQVIVVDDTNHTLERLVRLGEIAEQNRLVAIFLEPRTEWRADVQQLVQRNGRGLEEAQIQAMSSRMEEVSLPLFFGWFLLPGVQEKVRCTSMDFLKTLDTLEAFKKHLADFPEETEKELDLEQYFQPQPGMHCTTKFCNYGKVEGAKEYAEQPAVSEHYGSVTELSLTALFVTPRTVGARVSLTEEQLSLWPADAEKEAEAAVPGAASLPPGSRAHVTLGCARAVQSVQTGLDLLDILLLQREEERSGRAAEEVVEMELGTLGYHGQGRWLLSLREPVSVQGCFSGFYGPPKAEHAKKEAEKKKKPKCAIL